MADVKELLNLIGESDDRSISLIVKAYEFSKKAHEGQKRFSGEPYFNHVYETAKILAELGMDTSAVVAGLLHDVLKDAKTTEDSIKKEFGEDILFLVKGVTKLGFLKYRGREKHVESLRKFFVAMASDLRVVIIKFADRLHNLRTLEFVPDEKRSRIALESIEVYAPLANRLGMGKLKGDLEDTAFPYAFPDEYAQIEEVFKQKSDHHETTLLEIQKKVETELNKDSIKISEINYRMKRKYSLWKKLLKHEMDVDKIYDMIALRVVVNTVEDCYKTLGLIHSIWNPLPGRIKDYIAAPKPNGYRSIHTTVFTGEGGTMEIQIRTREMHAEAAYGIAAHFAYKEQTGRMKSNDKFKLKWIEELKNLNFSPDDPKKFLEHLKMDFFSDRIFIFTPEGDIVDLPENSSPIDFAYSIHSDIGDHISGAKINGKMSTIYSKLKNRDIVEIIKKKEAHPSNKWLEYAKTSMAKKHIRSYLERNSLINKLKSFGQS